MTETDDALERAEEDEAPDGEEWAEEPLAELVEQVGRDAGALAVRELELRAARNMPAVRRAGRDLLLAVVAVVAFVTAFALANWAAVVVLADVLPDWLAPLVLAAGWATLGVVFLLAVRHGVQGLGWALDGPEKMVAGREQAKEEAEAALRKSIERLGEAMAAEAEARIRDAVAPSADDVVEAGEEILDVADDLTDAIEESVPGGGLVNDVLDLALLPGRLGVRAARAALGRDSGAREPNGRETDGDRSDA